MHKRTRQLFIFLTAIVVLSVTAVTSESRAHRQKNDDNEILFSRAKIIIEFNSTANEGVGDVGVQVLLDGEPWKHVTLFSPDGRRLLQITSTGSLRLQGLTELFFESSEPSLDEVPLAEFLARFPEGTYEFEGKTIEGQEIEGEATFTHVIPAGPRIVSPVSQNDEPPVVDPKNMVIQWEPVTEKIAGVGQLVIIAYQVVIDGGNPSRRFDVTLAAQPTTMSVTVPPQFLEPGTAYTFEVLAIEAGGNQTITEGSFTTEPTK